ncbi:MAG: tRNA (adenosine(37)-N6)-threonylcarbamoyltransferase complex ATPase subunit type 1 TsaE [Spirochaetota bacterium]|nr:tRNA (adenosine(37)-N6)-threonylcarbamoyltransferase complex ATPase subunit type 1 TsaE [Spirochaetota bacterium]
MKREIITYSEEETLLWAEGIGRNAKRGDIYALYGEIGTGKTITTKGIARGLGIDEDITSPSFILLEIYNNEIPLYHFDLYRIENDVEFDMLSFEEYWEGRGVSVIEWAERAENRLPYTAIKICIEWIKHNIRRIIIEYPDD